MSGLHPTETAAQTPHSHAQVPSGVRESYWAVRWVTSSRPHGKRQGPDPTCGLWPSPPVPAETRAGTCPQKAHGLETQASKACMMIGGTFQGNRAGPRQHPTRRHPVLRWPSPRYTVSVTVWQQKQTKGEVEPTNRPGNPNLASLDTCEQSGADRTPPHTLLLTLAACFHLSTRARDTAVVPSFLPLRSLEAPAPSSSSSVLPSWLASWAHSKGPDWGWTEATMPTCPHPVPGSLGLTSSRSGRECSCSPSSSELSEALKSSKLRSLSCRNL